MKTLLNFTIFFLSAITSNVSSAQNDTSVCWGASFGLTGSNEIIIRNMPFEARNISVHPDDKAFKENQGLIDDLTYHLYTTLSIGCMRYKKIDQLILAYGLDFIRVVAEKKERNYTNNVGTETRGYGAALTYSTLYKNGVLPRTKTWFIDVFLRFTPKVAMKVPILEKEILSFGGAISYFELQAEGGWDRYDSDEPDKTFTLCLCLPISLYLGTGLPRIRGLPFNIIFGAHYPIMIHQTDMGKKADIEFRPTFFIACEAYEF